MNKEKKAVVQKAKPTYDISKTAKLSRIKNRESKEEIREALTARKTLANIAVEVFAEETN